METIDIQEEFQFSPEEVWNLLTDHANYSSYAPLKGSSLAKEGQTEKNGLGAIRKIETDKISFLEEIKVFDKFERFDYLIIECSVPMKHHGGILKFEKIPTGTRVYWTSSFDLLGNANPAIARATRSASTKMFKEILTGVKRKLELQTA